MSIAKVTIPTTKEIKWEVRFYPSGRKSKRIRKRFDRKVDAEKYLEHLQNQYQSLQELGTSFKEFQETTIRAEGDFYLTRRGIEISPSSRVRAESTLRDEIYPSFGHLHPMKVTKAMVYEFQNRLLRRNLEPSTVNRHVGVLISVLNYSVEHGRVPVNPITKLKPLKMARKDMRFWEESEAMTFLEFTDRKYPKGSKNRWVHVVYLVAINTGLRAGELWATKYKNLSASLDLLHITEQWHTETLQFLPTKGRSERYVPFSPVVQREVAEWISYRKVKANETIFISPNGNPIDHDSFIKNYFKKDLAQSQVKAIRFHDLRHTAGTLMIAKGLDLPTVQAILGHEDVETTMRYVHLLGSSIKAAAYKFCIAPVGKPEPEFPSAPVLQLVR